MLKQGDILTNNGHEVKVLGVCGEVVFVSQKNQFIEADMYAYTEHDLKISGWVPPKEKWVPKDGEHYWAINDSLTAYRASYDKTIYDENRITAGNCFKTKEEAQAAADKIKELLKSL